MLDNEIKNEWNKQSKNKSQGGIQNKNLFKGLFLGSYSIRKDGFFLDCNDDFAKLVGLSSKNIIGKTKDDLKYREEIEFFTSNDDFVFKNGTISDVNRIFTNVSPSPIVKLIKLPIKDDKDTVICVNGIVVVVPFSVSDYRQLTKEVGQLKKLKLEINELKTELKELKRSKNYLNNILDNIPGFVYWKDKNGVILGDNEAHAKTLGFNSSAEAIGKTDYDFSWHDQADKMRKNDLAVMRSEKILTIEEEGVLPNGQKAVCLTHKSPLRDENKKIIGVIGISLDVTRNKKVEAEAESLKLEAELQKAKIEEQEQFKKIAGQVVHDIRSPLASLLMIVKSCGNELSEKNRISLREAAESIGDISNNLLGQYKNGDVLIRNVAENRQPIMVSLLLLQQLSEKKHQYQNLPVTFVHDFDQKCNFSFVSAEIAAFKRMISNLINNAVEALDGHPGSIRVELSIDNERIKIDIADNGKGMPKEIIDKIMHSVVVTNKKEGHGIGLEQVRETLHCNSGRLAIDSKIGVGTKITLMFPIIESPKWITEGIQLNKGDTVVILDDDDSIHEAWEVRFKGYTDITLKHFTSAKETINFVSNFSKRNKLFLLIDFELLNQDLNGLDVIERTKIKRSILVTSHYADKIMLGLVVRSEARILPKQLASEVLIEVKDKKEPMLKQKQVDLIVIDDNTMFADSLADFFEKRGKIVDRYYSPTRFLKNISQYAKDVKICMDNDLQSSINGLDLAKQLHNNGYKHLYMLSGKDFEKDEVPEYLVVILKSDVDSIAKYID